MDKNTAQTVVKVLAVLYWIGAGLSALGALMSLFGSGLGMMGGGVFGGLFGALMSIIGIVMLALAVLYAFVGYGLWMHKNWARIVALVLAVIGLLGFPIGTIVGAVIIYLLGFDKEVKDLFV